MDGSGFRGNVHFRVHQALPLLAGAVRHHAHHGDLYDAIMPYPHAGGLEVEHSERPFQFHCHGCKLGMKKPPFWRGLLIF